MKKQLYYWWFSSEYLDKTQLRLTAPETVASSKARQQMRCLPHCRYISRNGVTVCVCVHACAHAYVCAEERTRYSWAIPTSMRTTRWAMRMPFLESPSSYASPPLAQVQTHWLWLYGENTHTILNCQVRSAASVYSMCQSQVFFEHKS